MAVAAMVVTQAVPAVGQAQDFDPGPDDEARPAVAGSSEEAFSSSVPGIYPVSEVVTGLTSPRGLAIDPATGFLWSSDRTYDTITVFDHSGQNRLTFGVPGNGSGQLGQPQGIAFSGNEVFVAEESNDRVQVFDKQGNHLRMWGSLGSLAGQFNEPCDVEVVGSLVYVADANNDRVQVFTKAGAFIDQFGTTGAGDGQLNLDCSGASLTHTGGEIFITDELNSRVVAFDLDGNWERNIGVGTLMVPGGVDADAKGQIWVADYGNSTVTVWSTVGAPLGTFGAIGTTLGTFSGSRGSVVDPSGDSVWTAEQSNHRIQAFTTLKCDGKLLTHVGTSYNDKLVTGSDNDVIHLGAGNDTANAGAGRDLVCAGSGNDFVRGNDGKDRIYGQNGDDILGGGKSHDKIYGGKGHDLINGNAGRDRIWGGDHADTLKGSEGDDKLLGERGNDTLRGGAGTDQCLGGSGNKDKATGCETTGGIP